MVPIEAVNQLQALVQDRDVSQPAGREQASHCSRNFHSHYPPFRGERAEGYQEDRTYSRSHSQYVAEPVSEKASAGTKPSTRAASSSPFPLTLLEDV